MKYTLEVELEHTRERVIELFDSVENLPHWQAGLISFEPIEGTPGQVGAKSLMKFKVGKRTMEIVETITERDLPRRFSGTYTAKGMWNLVENEFEELPGGRTLWKSHNEFRGENLLMKVMLLLMPGAFRKQSLKYMVAFKDFAENQPA